MAEPVILAAVFVDCFLYALRHRDLVFQLDDLLGTFDDPRQNAFASVVIQVLAVILDVAFAGDLRTERDHDQPAPDPVVRSADPRQMIRIEHQRVAGLEGERVLILLFREHIVRGAELLDRGVVQPRAFLHLSSDQEPLALDLGHFRLDVPAAAHGQGVSGDVAAVQTQHTGDRVPEG